MTSTPLVKNPEPECSRLPPTTVSEFVALLRKSRLADVTQVELLAAKFVAYELSLPATLATAAPAARFAKWLVSARLLTTWQANQLLMGRRRGFFLGSYRLLRPLGRGTMGVVYLAEHAKMRRQVAIKILPHELVARRERLDLFYREAQVTAALDHPHIVRAFDVNNVGDTHYLVMEYVDGKSLDQVVQEHGPLSTVDAMEYIRQAALGLQHAHEKGLIHRDIKPANIMRNARGEIKVLDMGLAHWALLGAEALEGAVVGTPDYMAPEQAVDSDKVDARADIYGLGCVLRFLLTAQPPYAGDSVMDILMAHQSRDPVDIGILRSDVSDDFAAILRRMTCRNPDQRYKTAGEVAVAAQTWLERRQRSAMQAAAEATKTGRTVLVADDDAVTRRILEKTLTKAGYQVRLAVDGREALELLTPDLAACLFDLNMPHASGLECLREAQRRLPYVPVLIVSEVSELKGAIEAMREGAFDYIPKPCRAATLLNRLEEALALREQKRREAAALSALMDQRTTDPELHAFLEGLRHQTAAVA